MNQLDITPQAYPAFNSNDSRPLYVKLANAIIEYINENQLQPGDALPSEKEMLENYRVSRITVRNAIQRLVTEGRVTTFQGKGAFVSEQRLSYLQGIDTLDQNINERGMDVTSELLEAGIFHPAQNYLDELKLETKDKVYKIKRLKRLNDKPFCIEIRHLPIVIADNFKLSELGVIPEVELLARDTTTSIQFVEYKVRGGLLEGKHVKLMGVPVETPTLLQFSTHYNIGNKPMMTGKRIYLADKIDIRFTVHKNGKMMA